MPGIPSPLSSSTAKLEPSEGHLTEIGKDRFLLLLERKVNEHGQQTFYFVKDSDNQVVSLFENSHRFTLEAVIEEHERRADADNLGYEQYDQYELDEIELSRLVVLSLISDTFLDTIRVRFSHLDNYDSLPGSALFMMALEACNASISHDIDGARQKLEAMSLDSYPGEDVTYYAGGLRSTSHHWLSPHQEVNSNLQRIFQSKDVCSS